APSPRAMKPRKLVPTRPEVGMWQSSGCLLTDRAYAAGDPPAGRRVWAEGRAPPGAQHSASIKAITARQLQALVRQLPTSGLIRVLERCSVRLNEGVIAHPDIGAALDPDAAPLASDEHAVVLLHQLTKCCVVVGALVAFGRARFQRRTL